MKIHAPQGTDSRPEVVAATEISKIQLYNVLKSSLYSSLQHEVPYAEILKELSGGMNQARQNNFIFKRIINDYLSITKTRTWILIFGGL